MNRHETIGAYVPPGVAFGLIQAFKAARPNPSRLSDMRRTSPLARVSGVIIAVASMLLASSAELGAQPAAPAPQPVVAPSLTEGEVVSMTVASNPGLRVALLALASAEWDIVSAEARYAFVLQLDGGFTRSESPRLIDGGVSTSESYAADAGAELRKELIWGTNLAFRLGGSFRLNPSARDEEDLGGGTAGPGYGLLARFSVVQPLLRGAGRDVGEAEILAAKARRTTAEHARDRAASELLNSVLTAYWELWYANAAVGIQDQSKALTVKQRDEAAARAQIGTLSEAEVLSFEARVATREEDVVNADVERQRRFQDLARQLGDARRGSALMIPAEDVPPSPSPPPPDAEAAALTASPEIRELEAAVDLARLQARTAEDPQRSRLDVEAYVQAEGLGNREVGGAFKQLGTLGAVSAHVGLIFETPLDGSARRAEAAKARLAIEIATARLAERKQSVVSEIRTALTREAAARRRLALAEQTVKIAERQLFAEQTRFQSGAATPLVVLEAEDQLRSAKLRVARTRADLLEASLEVQHLTGRLVARYVKVEQAVSAARKARPETVGARPMIGAF
jgi:outer membrane protein TolC